MLSTKRHYVNGLSKCLKRPGIDDHLTALNSFHIGSNAFYLICSLLLKKSSMRQLMKRQVAEMTWRFIFNGNERKWYLTSSPSFEITASSPARPEGPEEAEVSPLTSAFAFLGPML
jgi:hypothetical protein